MCPNGRHSKRQSIQKESVSQQFYRCFVCRDEVSSATGKDHKLESIIVADANRVKRASQHRQRFRRISYENKIYFLSIFRLFIVFYLWPCWVTLRSHEHRQCCFFGQFTNDDGARCRLCRAACKLRLAVFEWVLAIFFPLHSHLWQTMAAQWRISFFSHHWITEKK